jgi:hypothetical protein
MRAAFTTSFILTTEIVIVTLSGGEDCFRATFARMTLGGYPC